MLIAFQATNYGLLTIKLTLKVAYNIPLDKWCCSYVMDNNILFNPISI